MRRKIFSVLVILVLLFPAQAAQAAIPKVKVAGMEIRNLVKPRLNYTVKHVDRARKFKLRLLNGEAISFVSSDETVATVNESGQVKPITAGNCCITVISNTGKIYKCRVCIYDTKRRSATTTTHPDHWRAVTIKKSEVTNDGFLVKPGVLVNFTNTLEYSGEPEGLVVLETSKTSHLTCDSSIKVQKRLIAPLNKMIDAAYADGVKWWNIAEGGGWRDYDTQDENWNLHMYETDGHYGDNPYLSDSGVKAVPAVSSEHRTGFALDLQTTDAGYKWLEENSYKYGFILRYTGDKTEYTGVMDEFWHYTFVGVDVAMTCHREDLCLEEYYAKYVDVDLKSLKNQGP
jgi:LAS superfamily LD-carboxypeptidase LdcB